MPSGRKQPGQDLLWELLATILGNKACDSPSSSTAYKEKRTQVVVTFKAHFFGHFARGEKTPKTGVIKNAAVILFMLVPNLSFTCYCQTFPSYCVVDNYVKSILPSVSSELSLY